MVKNAGLGDNFRMKLMSIHGLIRFYGLYNISVLFYAKNGLIKNLLSKMGISRHLPKVTVKKKMTDLGVKFQSTKKEEINLT